jgi:hypothetical protein
MMSFSLHHLRFSQRVWESDFVRRSGFYTNRQRLAEIVRACGEAGLDAEVCEVKRWEAMPIGRAKLAPPYRQMSDDELLAATIRIVTRPMARAKSTKRDVEGAMA